VQNSGKKKNRKNIPKSQPEGEEKEIQLHKEMGGRRSEDDLKFQKGMKG